MKIKILINIAISISFLFILTSCDPLGKMLKKQIAKAYMQDKDVDVAILEEKLKKRAQWRKEMMASAKANADITDEDGW